MKKQRLRGVEEVAQVHMTGKWWSQGWAQLLLTSEHHSFHYASPLLSITGNCQGSLAQNATYQLCKTKTSFCFSFRMARFRELRREEKAQKKTYAYKNLIYDKGCLLYQWRKDWLFNNAEKTGSLNEFGSLPYFTYIKVDSKWIKKHKSGKRNL